MVKRNRELAKYNATCHVYVFIIEVVPHTNRFVMLLLLVGYYCSFFIRFFNVHVCISIAPVSPLSQPASKIGSNIIGYCCIFCNIMDISEALIVKNLDSDFFPPVFFFSIFTFADEFHFRRCHAWKFSTA